MTDQKTIDRAITWARENNADQLLAILGQPGLTEQEQKLLPLAKAVSIPVEQLLPHAEHGWVSNLPEQQPDRVREAHRTAKQFADEAAGFDAFVSWLMDPKPHLSADAHLIKQHAELLYDEHRDQLDRRAGELHHRVAVAEDIAEQIRTRNL